jgi:hypothetical protein
MGRPSPGYRLKSAARGALYQVVRDHFETFRAEAAGAHEGGGVPRFIEEEFRGCRAAGPSPPGSLASGAKDAASTGSRGNPPCAERQSTLRRGANSAGGRITDLPITALILPTPSGKN